MSNIYSQDTLKSPLFVPEQPYGRVEEFYDFGNDPVMKEEEKVNKPAPKKEIKAKTEKLKEKAKSQEQVIKQNNPSDKVLQNNPVNAQESEILVSSDTLVQEFKENNFMPLNFYDTINRDFSQTINTESAKETLTKFTQSLFSGHKLQPKNQEPLFIKKNEDGMIGSFLIILSLFALIKVAYFKKFKQYLTSFFNLRFNIQMLNEEKAVNEQVYSIMLMASLLITTTFIYQLINHYGLKIEFLSDSLSGFLYFKILALVFSAFILKIIVVKISGFVLNYRKLTSDYIFNLILFFNALNIILLPLIIGIQYINVIPIQFFFITGGLLIILTFAFMLQRLYILGNSEQGTSSYYIFLYLCTLEILPIILLFKLLTYRLVLI